MSFLPAFTECCVRLGDYEIPSTLHHDDCGAGNIAFVGPRPVIFDWGESAVAHPFFTLHAFLRDIDDDGGEVAAGLRAAYLSEWLAYEPMDRLVEVFDLAAAPAAVCNALSWQAALAALGNRRPFVCRYVMARAVRRLVPFATELTEGVAG